MDRPHAVVALEAKPARDQRVDVRGLDVLVAECADRIRSMVVGEQEEDVGPLVLGAIGASLNQPLIGQLALIWIAHIGLDRAIGYGLKYASGFKETHLARV